MEKLFGKYEVLPLEKGAGEIFEKKIDDYNDTVAPPGPNAPEDEELVFKITDKDAQNLQVVVTDGTTTSTFSYDLSGLVCETE